MQRLAAVPVAVILGTGLAVPTQAAADTDFFSYLRAASQYASARGDSEYEREGARREVEVTVTGIRSLAGKRVTVLVAGRRVGTMVVSSSGRAHRQWKTANQQSVPFAGAGSAVQVRTAGGKLIASGRYERERD